jgi:hypothetical protein
MMGNVDALSGQVRSAVKEPELVKGDPGLCAARLASELTLEVLLQRITAHIPHPVRFIEEKRRAIA